MCAASGPLTRSIHLVRRLADSRKQIGHPVDLLHLRRQLLGVRLELIELLAEHFDLDWAGGASEVVDHVREDLHELDVESRHGALHLHTHIS